MINAMGGNGGEKTPEWARYLSAEMRALMHEMAEDRKRAADDRKRADEDRKRADEERKRADEERRTNDRRFTRILNELRQIKLAAAEDRRAWKLEVRRERSLLMSVLADIRDIGREIRDSLNLSNQTLQRIEQKLDDRAA